MDEAALLARLSIMEGPIIAFNVKGGVKEFLRAQIKAHGEMNICAVEDGKVIRYGEMFERIYGESLEGKKKRARS